MVKKVISQSLHKGKRLIWKEPVAKPFIIGLGVICLFCSCAKSLHRDNFVISGTYLEVISSDPKAAKLVYNEFKRLDDIFNFYKPTSELSRLNNTYNKPVKVSAELIEVLKLSKQLYTMSNGYFDVSQGALYSFWKDLISKDNIKALPQKEQIDKLKELGGIGNIVIDAKNSTVTIKKKGLKIDLSGIAKGYMVDKSALILKENKIDSALINAGGEVYCLGTNAGAPWSVGIKDPEEIGVVLESQGLIDEAVATSGDYEQFFELGGKRYSHMINPRTGFPVQNSLISVSVITKNCTTADGVATAFSIMGLGEVEMFITRNPSTMRIFVLALENGKKNVYFFK